MNPPDPTGLKREMGLTALAATGICSMLGAAINIIPFTIQRNVAGIGPYVLPAYLFAAMPAMLAALAYAVLGSAMPRAGGSYVYASRALSPYLGFVASFSQWFGLSIAIGVVSYVIVPFIRDMAITLGWTDMAATLELGPVRLGLSLAFLWTFVLVNLKGLKLYERTLVPMMFLMFALGSVVIVAGFSFDHADFATALAERDGTTVASAIDAVFEPSIFLAASALLFSSFIGFDSIAQAGGEARNPSRNIPLAVGLAIMVVGGFYFLFTAAVYHAVPWQFVAAQAQSSDLTAPGLLGVLLPPFWTALIVAGAAVALINDLPAMLMAVSRLMFAWAEDGIFPKRVARVHPRTHTPHLAILLSGAMATVGILGSHLAGDFFLGVDILVTSMLVNFLVMCLSVLALPIRNPELALKISILKARGLQRLFGGLGALLLTGFLVIHIRKDLLAEVDAWYFRSTPVWLIVMALASLLFWWEARRMSDEERRARFAILPPE